MERHERRVVLRLVDRALKVELSGIGLPHIERDQRDIVRCRRSAFAERRKFDHVTLDVSGHGPLDAAVHGIVGLFRLHENVAQLDDGLDVDHEVRATIDALHELYPHLVPGKVVELTGERQEEGQALFDEWQTVKARLSADKKRADEIKNWMAAQAVDADLLRIDQLRSVTVKIVEKRGYEVKPSRYWDFRPKDERELSA